MPACAGLLVAKGSRLGLLKPTFNAENFICSLTVVLVISVGDLVILS